MYKYFFYSGYLFASFSPAEIFFLSDLSGTNGSVCHFTNAAVTLSTLAGEMGMASNRAAGQGCGKPRNGAGNKSLPLYVRVIQ